jgi:hypothetical protein
MSALLKIVAYGGSEDYFLEEEMPKRRKNRINYILC